MIGAFIGLGNPGRKYEHTRHNIGFLFLDFLANKIDKEGSWSSKFGSYYREVKIGQESVRLLKPQTYMNLSGSAVGEMVGFYKLPISSLLIIHDDVDLPFLSLRIKIGGGDGGHNGLKSITECLGASDFIRLRCGIGRPAENIEVSNWVLGSFDGHEKAELPKFFEHLVNVVEEIVTHGAKSAQNKFN